MWQDARTVALRHSRRPQLVARGHPGLRAAAAAQVQPKLNGTACAAARACSVPGAAHQRGAS